ncbi:putative separase [Rosa chinensis]|uniref:Putative separase n=1 Tax=Rosa chinensis TaxID=74649 RepID=A0A2P6QZY5_ROSCH|nr:putative separase [Rosa chinensis]
MQLLLGKGRDRDEEAAKKWVCRWGLQGSTGIDDIIPEYRIIMEGLHLSEPGGVNLISLDRRLQQFVKKLETVWFGSSKYVLLGEWSSCNVVKSANEKLRKKLEKKPTNLKVLIGTSTDALKEKTFLSQLYSSGMKELTPWALKQIQEEV